MAARLIPRHILQCDNPSCPAVYGLDDVCESPADVRMAAYNAGWRFPPTMTAKGLSFGKLSDACPTCAPTWEPQPAQAGHRAGYLTNAQLANLRAGMETSR